MPFIKMNGVDGLVYVPDEDLAKKHPCKGCKTCLYCSDARCRICLKDQNKKCRKNGCS